MRRGQEKEAQVKAAAEDDQPDSQESMTAATAALSVSPVLPRQSIIHSARAAVGRGGAGRGRGQPPYSYRPRALTTSRAADTADVPQAGVMARAFSNETFFFRGRGGRGTGRGQTTSVVPPPALETGDRGSRSTSLEDPTPFSPPHKTSLYVRRPVDGVMAQPGSRRLALWHSSAFDHCADNVFPGYHIPPSIDSYVVPHISPDIVLVKHVDKKEPKRTVIYAGGTGFTTNGPAAMSIARKIAAAYIEGHPDTQFILVQHPVGSTNAYPTPVQALNQTLKAIFANQESLEMQPGQTIISGYCSGAMLIIEALMYEIHEQHEAIRVLENQRKSLSGLIDTTDKEMEEYPEASPAYNAASVTIHVARESLKTLKTSILEAKAQIKALEESIQAHVSSIVAVSPLYDLVHMDQKGKGDTFRLEQLNELIKQFAQNDEQREAASLSGHPYKIPFPTRIVAGRRDIMLPDAQGLHNRQVNAGLPSELTVVGGTSSCHASFWGLDNIHKDGEGGKKTVSPGDVPFTAAFYAALDQAFADADKRLSCAMEGVEMSIEAPEPSGPGGRKRARSSSSRGDDELSRLVPPGVDSITDQRKKHSPGTARRASGLSGQEGAPIRPARFLRSNSMAHDGNGVVSLPDTVTTPPDYGVEPPAFDKTARARLVGRPMSDGGEQQIGTRARTATQNSL